MKQFIFILLLCLATGTALAQNDYTKSLEGIEWVRIESKADITVRTHSKNELLIKVGSSVATPDRAKGLKLVGEGGTDNTDVGFYVVQDGNNLIVKSLRKSEDAEIFLPATQNFSVKSTWHGDIEIEGFTSEIEANAQLNGGIVIREVTGPITANALNGEIEVQFKTVKQDSPISIYTTNGEVDVSLPQGTPADLFLSSLNGEIYTNFDLKRPDKDGLKSISTRRVTGSINNGGVSIKLKSTNGNIYLRKK
ncbi:DUF4097 family beta strand repeat-containing protein [Flavobacteriaceae bacterium 3-367]